MDYEKLGAFYLGREVQNAGSSEGAAGAGRLMLYDASDLTTHAVIVGMTGSGKTGLGVGLIEEAALDGVPVLAIDPKGDLGNLALTFPQLRGEDFEPWLDAREAAEAGTDLSSHAAAKAQEWREGLASWGQGPERIERLRAAATVSIYTPGSHAGRPISVLRSFAAPARAVLDDADLMAERLTTTATSLLTLLGADADQLGREHILLSKVLEHHWRAGHDLGIAALIQAVQSPPFDKVGVMSLETVFPSKDRLKLAMALNSLLAAPGFEVWTSGEPLSIQDLLYERDGKPRIAVITVSHLSDAERMFFLSLLFSEVVAWTRAQPGTGSLRAMVYVDELFGLLPPVAEPPTKKPLLTLLKQARAFGVGLALSTQNPVDLDYKALSNAGTWFIGRLQTARDVERLIDGLTASAGGTDVAALADAIAGLPKRTFVMHNVHESEPVTFQTRWAMSYLAGPLAREQIRSLSRSRDDSEPPVATPEDPGRDPRETSGSAAPNDESRSPAAVAERPFLPPHIDQVFIGPAPDRSDAGVSAWRYFPLLLAVADAHFSSKTHSVEHDERVSRLVEPVEATVPVDWAESEEAVVELNALPRQPATGITFADLPKLSWEEREFSSYRELFERWLRTAGALRLWRCDELKLTSRPDEGERAFRLRCAQAAREARDDRKNELLERYGSKLGGLERRILREDQAVGRERQQLQHRTLEAFGGLVGAILGGGRTTTAVSSALRKASSGRKELGDVNRARERLQQALGEKAALEAELASELGALESHTVHPEKIALKTVSVKPTSRDVVIRFFGLAWVAHREVDGRWTPVADLYPGQRAQRQEVGASATGR